MAIVKKIVSLAVAALLLLVMPAFAAAKEKVLLDADMVESFDDGVAMILLANAPGIDLVGVTTLTGNSWVAAGTANAIKQLEIEGKTSIPVAMWNIPCGQDAMQGLPRNANFSAWGTIPGWVPSAWRNRNPGRPSTQNCMAAPLP